MTQEAQKLLESIFRTPNEKEGDPLVLEFCRQYGEQGNSFISYEALVKFVESNVSLLKNCPPAFFFTVITSISSALSARVQSKIKELSEQHNIGAMVSAGIKSIYAGKPIKAFSKQEVQALKKKLSTAKGESPLAVEFIFALLKFFNNDESAFDILLGKDSLSAQLSMAFFYKTGANVNVVRDIKKAFQLYKKAANQGSCEAQYKLGFLYEYGRGVKQDLKKAFASYLKAANQGKLEAQYKLGLLYENGDGVEKDLDKAVVWYTQSAARGCREAQFTLGELYCYGRGVEKDLDIALGWYKKSADLGCHEAQYCLGFHYEKGLGVEQDIKKAIELYVSSASQDNLDARRKLASYAQSEAPSFREAQYFLGIHYEKGLGVEQDQGKALELYTLSAKQGEPRAQYSLAFHYKKGLGIKQDAKKALELYTLSAEQGEPRAQAQLADLYSCGRYLKKDLKMAAYWYKKSADQGFREAQYCLAFCYGRGLGVEKDVKKAVELYTQSARQGEPRAQYQLAEMYSLRSGTTKGLEIAVTLYVQSAVRGCHEAQVKLAYICSHGCPEMQYFLGLYYEKGLFVSQSTNMAIKLYISSARKGEPRAQYRLGALSEEGRCVAKDINSAFAWYTQSAAQGYARAQFKLGFLYVEGQGIKQNISEAIKLLRVSALQGYFQAQHYLGFIYKNGRYVRKDYKKAFEYLALASFNKNISPSDETMKNEALKALLLLYINFNNFASNECSIKPSALLSEYKEKLNNSLSGIESVGRTRQGLIKVLHLLDSVEDFEKQSESSVASFSCFGIHAFTPKEFLKNIREKDDCIIYPDVEIDELAKILGPIRFKNSFGVNACVQEAINTYRRSQASEIKEQDKTLVENTSLQLSLAGPLRKQKKQTTIDGFFRAKGTKRIHSEVDSGTSETEELPPKKKTRKIQEQSRKPLIRLVY